MIYVIDLQSFITKYLQVEKNLDKTNTVLNATAFVSRYFIHLHVSYFVAFGPSNVKKNRYFHSQFEFVCLLV